MSRKEQIQAEIERLQKELDDLERIPEEPTADPAVVFFEKVAGNDKRHNYTAVRVGGPGEGEWFITSTAPGRQPASRDWESLVEFARAGQPKGKTTLWMATGLEAITIEK